MSNTPAKNNILKKIRMALAHPTPLPFPKSEGAESVFQPQQQDLVVEFAEQFPDQTDRRDRPEGARAGISEGRHHARVCRCRKHKPGRHECRGDPSKVGAVRGLKGHCRVDRLAAAHCRHTRARSEMGEDHPAIRSRLFCNAAKLFHEIRIRQSMKAEPANAFALKFARNW